MSSEKVAHSEGVEYLTPDECRDNLINEIFFRIERERFAGERVSFLIVEGRIDCKFIDKFQSSNLIRDFVKFESAERVFNTSANPAIGDFDRSQFRKNSTLRRPNRKVRNAREAIIDTVKTFPNYYKNYIKNHERQDETSIRVYGMIDRDFYSITDKKFQHEWLFPTDTTDLETFIIKTGGAGIMIATVINTLGLSNVNGMIQSCQTYAYQFAKIYGVMNREINPRTEMAIGRALTSKFIDFGSFIHNGAIDVGGMLSYARMNQAQDVSDELFSQLLTRLVNSSELKDKIDPITYQWLWHGASGGAVQQDDFWDTISGHVFLRMLIYFANIGNLSKLSMDGKTQFIGNMEEKIEAALVDNYGSNCFRQTQLFKKMQKAHLVNA